MNKLSKFQRLTIRWRLTIIFAVSATLILIFAGYFIYTFSASFRKNEFKLRLQNRLEEVQEILRSNPDGPLPEFSKYDEAVLPREQLLLIDNVDTFKLNTQEGDIIILKKQINTKEKPTYFKISRRDIAVYYDEILERFIIVSAIDVYGFTKMNNLKKVIIICLICSVIMLAFVSWYWTRRMLAPIAAKINKARLIETSSLNLRLEIKNPSDELGLLAQTFNQMLDRLEKGFKIQQQFIGNASHEFRTPITVMRTEAEWALNRQRSSEEYQLVLSKVLEKCKLLGQLVDRLLILARLEGPQLVRDMQNFRLDELVIQTVESFRDDQKKVMINCFIESTDEIDYLVQGDASMIQTALSNLIDNALKYGLNNPVNISLSSKSSFYCCEIQDKGIGVDENDISELFQPFYRSAKARVIASGTGIGLALVYTITQWHGGSIKVNSMNGTTTFSLYLPKTQKNLMAI